MFFGCVLHSLLRLVSNELWHGLKQMVPVKSFDIQSMLAKLAPGSQSMPRASRKLAFCKESEGSHGLSMTRQRRFTFVSAMAL